MATVSSDRPLGEYLDKRQKWFLIASLMTSMFMGALDQTIMATATPKILADLGGFSLLSWMFTSYMLASTVVVPLVGKLSDIYGRKFFLMGGIVTFMVASALCGTAQDMTQLILFRGLQGIGGGVVFSSVFATIGDIFPPVERGKYMGLFTGTFSLASILGPTIGGLLTDHVGWRFIFYINVPIGLVALPAIWHNLPLQRSDRRPKIDVAGALLLSVSTISGLLALEWAREEYGWWSTEFNGLLSACFVFLAAFVWQESRHPEPIIPLALFRNREFVLANLVVMLLAGGMFGAISYLPTFVQTAMDASATASGLITTPQSLGLLCTSIVGGQLLSRTGKYKLQTNIGAGAVIGGVALLLTLGPGTPQWHVSVFMVILGLGFGFVMPTMSVVIQNVVSHQYIGVATSSRQFFMQIGQVVGIAIFGAVLASTYAPSFNDNVSEQANAEIAPATIEKFEDPTLSLDEQRFASVQAEIRALPNGEVILEDTLDAQKEGITTSMHLILLGSLAVVSVGFVLTFLMREVPLRTAFGPPAAGTQAAAEPQLAAAIDAH
ncbi:MAG: MFS transporter [Dehalococcoidia bacterium]|nr:MFS transporter [Dehalococcoidia bacterium]